MSISSIIDAIVEDDCRTVTSLLRADPSIASMQFRQAQLYWGKISHWIYVGDTPLHLAAAGYRVEIVDSLLAAGLIQIHA